MDVITLGDKQFVKYISKEEIDKDIERVGQQINEDYVNDTPVFIVTLNGAIVFAADLLKHIKGTVEISCVKLSSYEGIESTKNMKSLIGLNEDLAGRRVVIIEDIVDTGMTYEHIVKLLEEKDVKDIRIATMTFKPDAYTRNLPVHYIGMSIPNRFIVGRGLDYNGLGRNYPDIYQLKID